MATQIVRQPAPTINLSAVALEYVDGIDVAADMYLVEKMCCELAQIERLTGDSEFSDSELRYSFLVATGADIGYDDMPASLLPDC
jgi:hypothetical protein